ncbi:hypothetical protein TNCT_188081 [Trichonephila clavata]|uniref:C2H2-type domain-containing protein n=1 Tax=Trichonephila clavata TaxID=2740835 RepID=A0A8X6LM42_TRICU|nr:hypothetical protein TNCT_188081 [Trichonephila clavata]
MEYRCHNCNLEFFDFGQYLDHECKSHNAMQMTDDEARTLEKLFYRFKNANESHIDNISANEEKNKYWRTEPSLEVGGLHFDFNDYRANQLRYENLNESETTITGLDDFESYLQTQFAALEPNPEEVNYNQSFISSGQRQMSEINAHINNNPLSVSLELSPKQCFSWTMNQYRKKNQEFASAQYEPMQYHVSEKEQISTIRNIQM